MCSECAFDGREFGTHRPTHMLIIRLPKALDQKDYIDIGNAIEGTAGEVQGAVTKLEERMEHLEGNMATLLTQMADLKRLVLQMPGVRDQ